MRFSTILFIVILVFSSFCFNQPYIPAEFFSMFCLTFLFPAMLLFLYYVFLKKNYSRLNVEKMQKYYESIGYGQLRTSFMIYVTPLFLAIIFTYIVYNLPAIPTKWFAKKPFSRNVKVEDIFCSGYYRRPHTQIKIFDEVEGKEYTINYHSNLCRYNPGIEKIKNTIIRLQGREWFLGKFIDNFYYSIEPVNFNMFSLLSAAQEKISLPDMQNDFVHGGVKNLGPLNEQV